MNDGAKPYKIRLFSWGVIHDDTQILKKWCQFWCNWCQKKYPRKWKKCLTKVFNESCWNMVFLPLIPHSLNRIFYFTLYCSLTVSKRGKARFVIRLQGEELFYLNWAAVQRYGLYCPSPFPSFDCICSAAFRLPPIWIENGLDKFYHWEAKRETWAN